MKQYLINLKKGTEVIELTKFVENLFLELPVEILNKMNCQKMWNFMQIAEQN